MLGRSQHILSGEFQHQFQTKAIPFVVSMEQAVIKAANKVDFQSEFKKIGESCFKDDLDVSEWNTQQPTLHEIIKKASPDLRNVTSIPTICDVMDSNEVFREILPAVHKLHHLFLTIPLTPATAERAFSALKQVLTYSRSPMAEKRLNYLLELIIYI